MHSAHTYPEAVEKRILMHAQTHGVSLLGSQPLGCAPRVSICASALAFGGPLEKLAVFLESLARLDLPFQIREPHLARCKDNPRQICLTFVLEIETEGGGQA
jgi:hypothetical protein